MNENEQKVEQTYAYTVRFYFTQPKLNDGYEYVLDVVRHGRDLQYVMLDAIRDIKENIANDHILIYKAEVIETKPVEEKAGE